ncbi:MULTISPECIES: helix-turn-helix transcriptional regulator [unclassified Rathayibacter]|uniref:helix-turn-helix transcriptional regulator n=1 Tax=unclassified Rathayibacter TaxID=2609250 RepID=UPI000CE7C070|nr:MULTISPECIES: helix-turn-helix transcriptional regulator [unclassified Rathayibacter]PPF18458.1 AraC family transcriptional regulator [Rathayibacter sp. AY1A4]PPF38038.1 AraC family transcriptional regulator [Rathayibacter sp. AY1A3]PPG18153.1 AraC family transcriptional regulator [Rathayibacter sp. AY1C6]PPG83330.1 AraC family transcriptional regulator [Rathayibacter sp. AY1E5]PPH30228.1 AraC family transcriptional regulator [Rathayibacter sp. AY1C3]
MSESTFTLGSPFAGDERADRRYEASGDDPSAASAVYSEAYGGGEFRVAPLQRGFSYRYAVRGSDRVTLRTSDCSGALTGQVPHLKEYVVGWFRAGGGRLNLPPFTRTGALSAPFLFPAERQFGLEFEPHRQNLIHFAPGFLEDVATETHAGPRQPVSFDHGADADPGVLARWRAAVTEASAALATAAITPLVRFTAELDLARVLLLLFPWRAWDVPAVLRRPSASRTRVALDFLQHHAHEPITPADAARAAGLHTRTLQQATKRHLGVSPSVYLRDVRLDRAHSDLVAGDPCSTTVAAVAREWGFGNLGRFASAYQVRFDEKPSHTLRR